MPQWPASNAVDKDNTYNSNTNSGSNSNSSVSVPTSPPFNGGTEYFANCTELRTVYPNGVPSNHPAYQSKMDRDKDNFACER